MVTIVTNSLNGSATFDTSRRYRYSLTRAWSSYGQHPRQVTFVMLNPSEANAEKDDPTIRACSQFAHAWRYTQLNVVNLFAYRTPHPLEFQKVANPVGTNNDGYLLAASADADKIILAWGNWGNLMNRAQAVVHLLTPHHHKLHYLIRNRSGQPRHPLYIKRSTQPQLFLE